MRPRRTVAQWTTNSRSLKSTGAVAVIGHLASISITRALSTPAIADWAGQRLILDQFQPLFALAEAVVPGHGLRGCRNHDVAGQAIDDLPVGAGDLTEDPQGFGSPGLARESCGAWRKIIRGICFVSPTPDSDWILGRPMPYSSTVFT